MLLTWNKKRVLVELLIRPNDIPKKTWMMKKRVSENCIILMAHNMLWPDVIDLEQEDGAG